MRPLPLPKLILCGAIAALPSLASAQVVINEFQYDDESTDDREFVELYNAGALAVDISGWTLQANDQNTPNVTYTVQPGTILAPGAFWVMGSSLVPNINQVVTGPSGGLWENDQETLELFDTTNTRVDFVCYEVNKALFVLPAHAEGQGLWGNFQSNLYTTNIESSWSRQRDGYDTNDNGRDFRIVTQTPGATNNYASVLPYFENFDAFAPDAVVTGWGGSFKPPFAVDPTVAGLINPNAIAASPVGGNVGIFWDPTGGGDLTMLLTEATDEIVFEAYVYFDATARPAAEYETWSLCLQGGTCSFHNHPDPVGAIGAGTVVANGNVGVSWVYVATSAGATLYLIDSNDGGWGATAISQPRILGQIAVTPGVNDGWQRLRLQATKGLAEGFFGGTYGALDGTRIAGAIDGKIGGVAIGYREFLVNNAASRPFTADFMVVRANNATVEYFGNATPTTTATPQISALSFPILGNAAFGAQASNVPANSAVAMLVGFFALNPGINLSVLGAQPGSAVLVSPDLAVTLPTNGNGEASLQLGLPNTPAAAGAAIFFQAFAVDPALGNALPVAQTKGMRVVLGN